MHPYVPHDYNCSIFRATVVSDLKLFLPPSMEDSFHDNHQWADGGCFSEDDEYDIRDTPLSQSLSRHANRSQSNEHSSSSKWTSKNRQRDSSLSDKKGFSPRSLHGKVDGNYRSPKKNIDGVFLGEEDLESSGKDSGHGGSSGVSAVSGSDSDRWAGFVMAVIRLDLWKLLLLAGIVGIVVGGVYQGRWSSKFAVGFSGHGESGTCCAGKGL